MPSLFELESEGDRTTLTIRGLPINSTEEERATFAGAMERHLRELSRRRDGHSVSRPTHLSSKQQGAIS
jgi:hypothetical protein